MFQIFSTAVCYKKIIVFQNCKVEHIEVLDGKVSGVRTNLGTVYCENFVNTAGFWARHIGTLSYPRVQIPLHPGRVIFGITRIYF
jgi:pyruvate dehydrogenase phosphatase regulatory subunit